MSRQVPLIVVLGIALLSIPYATGQPCIAVNDCKTGQQCRFLGTTQQCVWPCDGPGGCPQSGDCISGICLYGANKTSAEPIPIEIITTSASSTGPTPTSNITASETSQDATTTSLSETPSTIGVPYVAKVSDKAFQTTFIILTVFVGLGAIGFAVWWWRRRQHRIHRFQTLVNTPRSSIIDPSTSTRGVGASPGYLDVPHMTQHTTSLDEVNVRLSESEVGGVEYQGGTYSLDAGSGNTLGVPEQTIYGSNAASTSSIDLAVEPAQLQEPYKDV